MRARGGRVTFAGTGIRLYRGNLVSDLLKRLRKERKHQRKSKGNGENRRRKRQPARPGPPLWGQHRSGAGWGPPEEHAWSLMAKLKHPG